MGKNTGKNRPTSKDSGKNACIKNIGEDGVKNIGENMIRIKIN